MLESKGGCLCGNVRYSVSAKPSRITNCHCKFCQKATGGAYLVEPIFDKSDLTIIKNEPKIFEHRSEGSGKMVFVHFCDNCGTKLYLTFERFPDAAGIFAGTFDDPNWFEQTAENSKHIFLSVARAGTIIPAGINTFQEHATTSDGTPIVPTIFETPHIIGQT